MKYIIALLTLSTNVLASNNYYGGTTVYKTTNDGRGYTNTYNSQGAHGVDSNGNSWGYDRNTGNYWNTNGKYCTGHGAYRTCN